MTSWRDSIPEENDSGEREYTHVFVSASSSGDNAVLTVTTGKRFRIRRVIGLMPKPDSSAFPVIKIMCGATEMFRGYAIHTRQRKTGPTNGSLVINLSEAASVSGTIVLEEIT